MSGCVFYDELMVENESLWGFHMWIMTQNSVTLPESLFKVGCKIKPHIKPFLHRFNLLLDPQEALEEPSNRKREAAIKKEQEPFWADIFQSFRFQSKGSRKQHKNGPLPQLFSDRTYLHTTRKYFRFYVQGSTEVASGCHTKDAIPKKPLESILKSELKGIISLRQPKKISYI
jgi:hypothetical protein